jgi:5-methylcytosine-specific restriction endonuclease McrA
VPRLVRRRALRNGKWRRGPEAAERRWRVRMLVRASGGHCRYCGILVPRDSITIDHIVPLSKGGLDVAENLALACERCNREKGNGIVMDLYLDEGVDG